MAPARRRPRAAVGRRHSRPARAARSADRATPPEAMTGSAVAGQHGRQPVEVGAGQRAVAVDGGDDHRGQPGPVEPVEQLGDGAARCPAPSPGRPPRCARRGPAGSRGPTATRPGNRRGQRAPRGRDPRGRRCRGRPGHSPPSRSSATSASERTPPPVCTGIVDGGGDGQHRRHGWPGGPSGRRRGRRRGSTGAPPSANRRASATGSPVAGSRGRSRPGSAGRRRRRGGRWPGRAPSPAGPADGGHEVGQDAQTDGARLLGVELRRPTPVPARPTAVTGPP